MKLTDLNPRWFSVGRDNKNIAGISFLCPCCKKIRFGVRVNHSEPHIIQVERDPEITHISSQVWKISGDNPSFNGLNHGGFENVSLTPSIDGSKSGHWHGFITNGEVT